ncbi:MAG TPA: malate dehydrogenase [Nitrospiria bacterium]|jgi:malate dehydrogenase
MASKITIVGAGNVGGTTAQRLAEKHVTELILLDIAKEMAQGKALDLMETGPLYGYDTKIVGTDDYSLTEGSDLVIITSGVPRKPGMSRADLLKTNTGIVKSVTEQVIKKSPNAILLVVSNPLDAMTHVAFRISGFPRQRVLGMAGALDSARFRCFIAQELNVSVKSVHALVLGGHGDSMVPALRLTTVAGIPVSELIPKKRLDALVQRTRDGGAEIVKLLKQGSAFYAPSGAIVEMVESILKDNRKILPCAARCEGEYGFQNLFVGVPVKLGIQGMEEIIEVSLSPEEKQALEKSAHAVRDLCNRVDQLL